MTIARNHRGWRIGESHPRAKLTHAEVRAMRARYLHLAYAVGGDGQGRG